MRTFRAAPRASVLIESMRDVGYSLETAVADIVDNSITAGSTAVRLLARPGTLDAAIGILDNGRGMTEVELEDAMRPGSRNPLDQRERHDLGRFGLGLKTASFSQCRRLTVVSRKAGVTSSAIWDLDYVAETDDWWVQVPQDLDSVPWFELLTDNGTLVVWERIDRFSASGIADAEFSQRIADTAAHMELVFHRFLSGEPGMKKTRMYVNDRPLEPLDPFHANHPATMRGPEEIVRSGSTDVRVQAFTLPHHSKVKAADWKRHALPGDYLKNQGFYVYRAKRLIIYGTWFSLARQSELTKLCRVRIDIPNGVDADWKIDIKKASASPPPIVRERLRRLVETMGNASRRVYRSPGARMTADSQVPVWIRTQSHDGITYRVNPEHPAVQDMLAALDEATAAAVQDVLRLIGAALPFNALFADLADDPEKVTAAAISADDMTGYLRSTVQPLRATGLADTTIVEMLRQAEPFRSHWDQSKRLLDLILSTEGPQ